MCQCRFIDYNKYTTMVQDVKNGGGSTCVRTKTREELCSFILFCCEVITAPKISLLIEKTKYNII